MQEAVFGGGAVMKTVILFVAGMFLGAAAVYEYVRWKFKDVMR